MREGTSTLGLLILVAGAMQVGASSLSLLAAQPDSSTASPTPVTAATVDSMNEVTILADNTAPPHDQFGRDVAISGDTAIVGAFDHDLSAQENAGAAYIFDRNLGGADNWGRVKKIAFDDAGSEVDGGDEFGLRVAISGDVAVVSAFRDEFGSGPQAGTAYVFYRNQSGTNHWGQVREITAIDPAAGDQFGRAVAIDGDTIVVGAWAKANAVGAAYVYQRNEGGTDNWGFVKKLLASDGTNNDQFGISVDISGDTIVVGANGDDVGGANTGSAYVFERNQGGSNQWGQVRRLNANDPEGGVTGDEAAQFGGDVAVAGDVIVVGALGHNHGVKNAGAAYVYQRDQGGIGNWGFVKELRASDRQLQDQFGVSVAVSTVGLAVVGAFGDEFGVGTNAGSAYLFDRNLGGTDTWEESRKLLASDADTADFFGWSAAVSDNVAVVGAPYSIFATTREPGNAYIFDLPGGESSLKFFISHARSLLELLSPARPLATPDR